VLKSIGAAGIGGASMALFDSEIVQGLAPQSIERSEVDWSGSEDGDAEGTFPLSVASGGPTDSGAILWTKIAADAAEGSTPAYVQVASDEEFSDVIYEGKVPAGKIDPDHDHIVKTDLDGELPADAHLYYRFQYAGTTSQTGRCRTLPEPDASPGSVKLTIANCQLFQHGYYPAYSYIADADVDYIVHLGDQIYEYTGEDGYGDPVDLEGRGISLPSGNDVAWTLEDFRHLWRRYRGDRFFQRALERHTFVPTWDDHEIINNRYWDYENDRPWADSHPKNDDPEFMRQLFVEGIKAWWEYNPARVAYDPDADSILDSFHMWRSLRFGDLLELPVTGERLFSSLPPVATRPASASSPFRRVLPRPTTPIGRCSASSSASGSSTRSRRPTRPGRPGPTRWRSRRCGPRFRTPGSSLVITTPGTVTSTSAGRSWANSPTSTSITS
jgi:alkaline phosphatase D